MSSKSAFVFSQRRKTRAVFLLLVLMAGMQGVIYHFDRSHKSIDFLTFDKAIQATIDSLKRASRAPTIYPFNPNYLSDYRAYLLQLTTEEIDRIKAHRQNGKWINSPEEFQRITGVAPNWMEKYAPFFKFPKREKYTQKQLSTPPTKATFDVNIASLQDLQTIKGIGTTLSQRIINYRTYLGGYSTLDQLDEVYGLSPPVLARLKGRLVINQPPQINKIDMNNATLRELVQLPYINYEEGRRIIALRSVHGKIDFSKLQTIKQFDSLKIKRLALYLF